MTCFPIGISQYAELDAVDGVLTACTLAIALTGTIVLRHAASEGRRAITLMPDYHLCVIGADQIVETVPEAFRRIAAPQSRPPHHHLRPIGDRGYRDDPRAWRSRAEDDGCDSGEGPQTTRAPRQATDESHADAEGAEETSENWSSRGDAEDAGGRSSDTWFMWRRGGRGALCGSRGGAEDAEKSPDTGFTRKRGGRGERLGQLAHAEGAENAEKARTAGARGARRRRDSLSWTQGWFTRRRGDAEGELRTLGSRGGAEGAEKSSDTWFTRRRGGRGEEPGHRVHGKRGGRGEGLGQLAHAEGAENGKG